MIQNVTPLSEQSKNDNISGYSSDDNQNLRNRWYVIHINSIVFFITWLAYAIISLWGLVGSSNGWGAIAMLLYGFLFYGGLSLVVLTIVVNKLIAKKIQVTIDARIVLILFFVQLLALAGITGDCGDQMCDHPTNFGYQIAHFFSFSETAFGSLFTSVTAIVGPIAMLGYLIILFCFLANTFFNQAVYRVVVFALVAVILIGGIYSIVAIPTILDSMKITTAVGNNDASGCAGISGYDDKRSCYIKIAKETGDYTICDSITMIKNPWSQNSSDIRDACYLATVYLMEPSLEVCNKVTSIAARNDCFSRIADEKACASIVDGYDNSKDRCYYNLGIKLHNNIYCENIASTSLKATCYSDIDYYTKQHPNRFSLPTGE